MLVNSVQMDCSRSLQENYKMSPNSQETHNCRETQSKTSLGRLDERQEMVHNRELTPTEDYKQCKVIHVLVVDDVCNKACSRIG